MKSQKPICQTYPDGTKKWLINGELHRTDGPAYEHSDGTTWWYLNGKLHRTDGPAIENIDGVKEWFLNDKCHRTDGPAIEYSDGAKRWYLNDLEHDPPPKSYKNPLNLGDLVIINGFVNFVCKKENLACLLNPSNQWVFEWERSKV